jgi:hypothetical protein
MSVFSAEIRQMIIPGRGGEYGPLPPLLVAMTMVTGLVDAFSYLVLGHVFVANMTGHVVFLAFALIGRELAPNRRRRRRPYSAAAWELWSRTRGLAGGHRLPDQRTMTRRARASATGIGPGLWWSPPRVRGRKDAG